VHRSPSSPAAVDPPVRPYEAFFHVLFRDLDPGDFPFKFSVETTNHCNLGCPLCPRQQSGRGHGYIDPALFARIASEAAGRDILFYPQGFGESLLHPRYREMLHTLKTAGVRYPVMITNGTLLDEGACRDVIESEVACLIISLDGADPELFERLRPGADYAAVVANAKRLFELREQLGATRPHVVLSVVAAAGVGATLERFREHWQPYLRPTDEIFVCSPVTWASAIAYGGESGTQHVQPPGPRPPCRMLYKTMVVYYDGRATPCSYDHSCQLEIGNAREHTIEQLWNGTKLRRLRELHEQGRSDEIPLCRDCPDWIP
jgi:radical SAM protein with 4Fe4S-binding SPASM domain